MGITLMLMLKERGFVMGSLVDMEYFYRVKARVLDLDKNINNIERSLKCIANQSYRILKVSNEYVKSLSISWKETMGRNPFSLF